MGSRPVPSGAWRAGLTHPRLPVFLAILAAALALPSLWAGQLADDQFHRVRMLGAEELPELSNAPMDMFVFASSDPEKSRRLIEIGCWPWWTLPELRAAFFRPVTVLTHWLDYHLWPGQPMLMHGHSILWFAGLVAAVAFLYRRLIGLTWIAGLAALLFAIDDARGMPVGFLANRNAVIAAVFGMLAIGAHDRWRRDGWRFGAAAAPALLLASLLSAEIGIGTIAYLFAHAVFLDPGTRRQRVIALLPYVAVVLGWRLLWSHLGYGVWGMDYYVDPVMEPGRFTVALLERIPLLLLGQILLPPAELYLFTLGTGYKLVYWVAALALLVLLAIVMSPRLRWDRMTRFWVTGMLLSLIPLCATFPADRLLFFSGLGAFPLVAQFLTAVLSRSKEAGWSSGGRLRRVPALTLGILFVIVHAVFAPVVLAVRTGMPIGPPSIIENLQVQLPDDPLLAGQSVIVVASPLPLGIGHLPVRRALDGLPLPAYTRVLAPHLSSTRVRRPDSHTLVVRPERGYLLMPGDRLARGASHPLALGERVDLPDLTAEVISLTNDGRPAEVAFRFRVPLEHPSLRWLTWRDGRSWYDGGYVTFTPPPIGATALAADQCHAHDTMTAESP